MDNIIASKMGVKRSRHVNAGQELRILIPSRVAGSIIGQRGGNITRLRTENKATISVPDCPGPERLISIWADDQETTMSVLAQILPYIMEGMTKDGGRVDNTKEMVEVRFLFHQNHAGAIIGKAGAKIKELRETSGANIKIFGACCPGSTDRVIAVTGSIETVLNAGKQILVLVSDHHLNKEIIQQYDPHNYDEMHALQYGGFVETNGPFVGGGKRHRPMGGRGEKRYRPMGGDGEAEEWGSKMWEGTGLPRGGRHSGRQRGVPSGYGRQYDEQAESTTTQVTIPKEYAGAIIGKGGSRIRSIRSESGAGITIAEPVAGKTDRIITITGAPGQIRVATVLLRQNVVLYGSRSQF